jgi:phosphoribosylanthranilate isomerase
VIKVKICGVRTVEDAMKCVACGADAVGVLLADSPRRITILQAADIVKCMPPFVTPVIVMMPSAAEEAIEAAGVIGPGAIQLQGDEPPEMLLEIKKALPHIKLIKAVHVGSGGEMDKARSYEGTADAILLDTMSPGRGGSGRTHDWTLSGEIVADIRSPVVLAGGLSPSNVAEAIKRVRPFAVDVASGVEGNGRVKDIKLIEQFIGNARGAQNGN